MSSKIPRSVDEARLGRRLNSEIRDSLRELGIQLSLLNHHVSARLDIKDVDLDCLNLIDSHGPISPGSLARRAGLHPATITGILDRLERGGWVTREADPSDRRAVLLRAPGHRNPELLRLYSGMSESMNKLLAGYDNRELELMADFLRRTASAGQQAADKLGEE